MMKMTPAKHKIWSESPVMLTNISVGCSQWLGVFMAAFSLQLLQYYRSTDTPFKFVCLRHHGY